MGVVTVSSSAAQTPLGLSSNFSTYRSHIKRPILIVAFKSDKSDTATTTTTSLVSSIEKAPLPLESPKEKKLTRKGSKHSKRVKALATDVSPCPVELDYNEAAAKLENLYKLSTAVDVEVADVKTRRGRQVKRKSSTSTPGVEEDKKIIVKSRAKKARRLSLKKRIELKNAEEGVECSNWERKGVNDDEREKINSLLRDHSASTDLVSLDWRKMKIPPVLPAVEHTWLFTLMQPMKALMQVKGQLATNLGREPTEPELAEATNTNVFQLRKDIEVGHTARNKLIKHNLRLILFVINKYFQDFANSPKFQDLCQEGVKGLITAIDRFEPKRKFRLSTYALFWIRHAIIRSMTLSSFTRVSFGLESIRVEIQKTKLELLFELQRQPTEEEIIQRVGISPERYREVMRATKPVISLHSRNATTQEELINCITDVNGGDTDRQPALLRLALDDVLDSLKPKESLVIRQRYGLDGKGDRTLGEIAGNLNISREMVRKYEVKALMKLKFPVRVDYLRRYAV